MSRARKHLPIGTVFGKLTVVGGHFMRAGEPWYRCVTQCACGKVTEPFVHQLRYGSTSSCGCGRIQGLKRAWAEQRAAKELAEATGEQA